VIELVDEEVAVRLGPPAVGMSREAHAHAVAEREQPVFERAPRRERPTPSPTSPSGRLAMAVRELPAEVGVARLREDLPQAAPQHLVAAPAEMALGLAVEDRNGQAPSRA
jgi:hypothetical protein